MEAKTWQETVMNAEEVAIIKFPILKSAQGVDWEQYAREYDKKILQAQAEISFKEGMVQGKWEVGEVLCSLVGNLMLEDMGKGKLLGEQLRFIFDYCKSRKPVSSPEGNSAVNSL